MVWPVRPPAFRAVLPSPTFSLVNRTLLALTALAFAALSACRLERAPSGRPGGGFAPEPDSLASAEVYAALRGYYAALTARDWRLLTTHFWPRATLTTLTADADSAEPPPTLTIEEFVAGAGRARAEVFSDDLASASVVTYGALADAWVTYRARVGLTRDSVASHYGIDAFHLVRRAGRWRIASLATQNELPGRPLAPGTVVRR